MNEYVVKESQLHSIEDSPYFENGMGQLEFFTVRSTVYNNRLAALNLFWDAVLGRCEFLDLDANSDIAVTLTDKRNYCIMFDDGYCIEMFTQVLDF